MFGAGIHSILLVNLIGFEDFLGKLMTALCKPSLTVLLLWSW